MYLREFNSLFACFAESAASCVAAAEVWRQCLGAGPAEPEQCPEAGQSAGPQLLQFPRLLHISWQERYAEDWHQFLYPVEYSSHFRIFMTLLLLAVSFLKRAQIFAADVWARFGGEGYGEFHDIDSLTMFADYRLAARLMEALIPLMPNALTETCVLSTAVPLTSGKVV